VGVSLINSVPEELIYGALRGVKVSSSAAYGRHGVEVCVCVCVCLCVCGCRWSLCLAAKFRLWE